MLHARSAIAAIILAAGSSSRMGEGRHKLLLPLGGQAVLAHVVAATLASEARPVVIVLGHQAELVRASIDAYAGYPALTIVENPAYQQGMSGSLRLGLQTLLAEQSFGQQPAGALIVLGDQPLMTAQVLDRLIATRETTGKAIVAPLYDGKRGNPVLFDARLFPELLNVTGDEGGRRVVEQHRADMATIEMDDALTSYDVDTWEAYQQVLREWQRKQGAM